MAPMTPMLISPESMAWAARPAMIKISSGSTRCFRKNPCSFAIQSGTEFPLIAPYTSGNLGGASAAQDSVGLKTKKDTSKSHEKRIVVAVLHFFNIAIMPWHCNTAAPSVAFEQPSSTDPVFSPRRSRRRPHIYFRRVRGSPAFRRPRRARPRPRRFDRR